MGQSFAISQSKRLYLLSLLRPMTCSDFYMSRTRRMSSILRTKTCFIQIVPLATESYPRTSPMQNTHKKLIMEGWNSYKPLVHHRKVEQRLLIGCNLRKIRTPLPSPCMRHSLAHRNLEHSLQPRCPPCRVLLQPRFSFCLGLPSFDFPKSWWAAFEAIITG